VGLQDKYDLHGQIGGEGRSGGGQKCASKLEQVGGFRGILTMFAQVT